ncbi:PKD domain-containing protein [Flavobacterium anhuiense]|uniref:PKD domain-containing protein n=1 Tax=Flavobacterium anhuiense TaxID=459526 RepID=UPI000E6C72AD|nr:hypothetical protein [Flavobacterium anhuiense]
MSYYIDIIDTTSPEDKLVIEQASASGIILQWSGGDSKDGSDIVGSNIRINMLSRTDKDGAFINFYTGDERRFLVQIKSYSDDSIIWQGYLLPDQYSEPYKSVNFFVDFTATCGLGRLKAKYLPSAFYDQEKSVIEILCECLKLTGLNLPLYFSPAILNRVNKDWNTIYMDTERFVEGSKNKDAYSILQMILQDTLCVCFQCDNRWYVDGFNKRNVRKVDYAVYDISTAVLTGNVEYNRLLKNITALGLPIVNIISPYNEVRVLHKKTQPSLPKSLSKEVNDGWSVVTGVVGEIHSTDWMGNGGLFAKCVKPDYYVTVYNKSVVYGGGNIDYPQDDTQWISLKEKVYVSKGQKLNISFDFSIKRPGDTMDNPSNMNLWKNPFKYIITFNNTPIYSNFPFGFFTPGSEVTKDENVIFDMSGTAKLELEHIFTAEGLVDIKIYGPPGATNTNRIQGIEIRKAEIEIIGFVEDEIITDVINGEFSIDKEVELNFADDKSGFSKGFRLAKLKNETTFFNEIEVPILYGFTVEGKNYSVVQLIGANLISENKFTTYRSGSLIEVLDVIYNYNDGEQMVVETAVPFTSGSFFVKKYAVDDVISSRDHWTQWTDSVYKIENTSYAKTVANIYRRMFNEPVERIDFEVKNAIKFNDIILFKYVYQKDFYVLNATWNLDANQSTITVARSNYKDNGTDPGDKNIPPIVIAGNDIYISNSAKEATLLATAFDPDGFIMSQQWTKITGGFGDIVVSPNTLETQLKNLTEDFYTYQIQVTDNNGATATDTVNVIREKTYVISLEMVEEVIEEGAFNPSIYRSYKLVLTPELLTGITMNLNGAFRFIVGISGTFGVSGEASYQIVKNGAVIENGFRQVSSFDVVDLNMNYIAGDVIYFNLFVGATAGDPGSGDSATVGIALNLNSAALLGGAGTISGLPIEKSQSVSVIS